MTFTAAVNFSCIDMFTARKQKPLYMKHYDWNVQTSEENEHRQIIITLEKHYFLFILQLLHLDTTITAEHNHWALDDSGKTTSEKCIG